MQNIRNSILRHVRVGCSSRQWLSLENGGALNRLRRHMCVSTSDSSDKLMDRVIDLVKKFDRIDSTMVTETADFQKDLSLDSLDRVELVMAFEEEFSIEIPDEAADKLTCCADVAKYISSSSSTSASGAEKKTAEN